MLFLLTRTDVKQIVLYGTRQIIILSAVYERKKISECYMLAGVVRSEILSKDMVIISAYDLERNEENDLFSQEQGNTSLSALRN